MNVTAYYIIFCLVVCGGAVFAANTSPVLRYVRVENHLVETHNDIVIDVASPRFSWALDDEVDINGARQRGVSQSAYRLTITALSDAQLICDSGVVHSSRTLHVQCEQVDGRLMSDRRYQYNIQYWTNTAAVSLIHTGTFRTAFYHPNVDWTAQWIGSTLITMNQLRKEFTAPSTTVNATVFIAGIGYYHLYINGQQIDPSRRLDPGWTTYEKRVYYTSFDVTSQVKTGAANAIGVILGLGWYNREQWAAGLGAQAVPMYGPPARLLFQLNLLQQNGQTISVISDSSWTGRTGPSIYDGVYMGNTYDSRVESPGWNTVGFTDARYLWLNASIVPTPLQNSSGVLQLQPMDPVRIGHDNLHIITSAAKTGWFNNPPGVRGATINASVIIPVSVRQGRDLPIWDLQQNIAGWCTVSRASLHGSSIQLRYSETLLPHQLAGQWNFAGLNTNNNEYIAVTDQYIYHSDDIEVYESNFTYHGFRYIGISGIDAPAPTIQCYPVHSETTLIGNFTSSSVVINQIQHNHLWAMLSNAMSLPTDCPQRNERRGWLGDAGLSIDMALFNFDLYAFYQSFLLNIIDNQDDNGALPDTAPFTCCNRPTDPGWGVAFSNIAKIHYYHYNDTSIVSTFYNYIENWILWLNTQHAETGLAHFYHKWGDWAPAGDTTNISLITSFSYLKDVNNLIELSDILNKTDKAQTYRKLYSSLATEWHNVFYHPDIKGYADNIQAANVLSLALPNVVPDNLRATVVDTLVKRIQSDGHITEGIISIDRLFPVLSTNGHHDLALTLVQQITYPSYGYMSWNQLHNATTLWESWSGDGASYNHHMYGSLGAWFYRYVAGIDLVGLDEVTMWPRMSHDASLLSDIQAEVVTLRGPITIDWRRLTQTVVQYSIAIPNGMMSATKFDPVGANAKCVAIIESGKVIWKRSSRSPSQMIVNHDLRLLNSVDGIHSIQQNEQGVMTARVSGGQYEWIVEWEL